MPTTNLHELKKLTPGTIKEALLQQLPGQKAQVSMSPQGRSLLVPDGKIPRQSAVLLPLFYRNEELHLCFTKRNRQLKHHPGQISFPGGKFEQADKNTLTTALRETTEEIGIDAHTIELLGRLSDLYIPVSNYLITPYVGFVNKKTEPILNKSEVEKILSIPLSSLFGSEARTCKPVVIAGKQTEVPCYYIDNEIIWGATSMILAELEAILKQHYSHRATH